MVRSYSQWMNQREEWQDYSLEYGNQSIWEITNSVQYLSYKDGGVRD